MDEIIIEHANQGNLKDVSLRLPKNKLIAVTGVSGSGKSTLVIDVLFNECQRQYLEAFGMQGIQKPGVERIQHACAAVCVNAQSGNRNPRSSVGTATNLYTDLRMLYEKLGVRECPNCHQLYKNSVCAEETIRIEDEYMTYQYCPHCHEKVKKLMHTDFSFNTREGACKDCEGMGSVWEIDLAQVLHADLSLSQGAVTFWKHRYQAYMISQYVNALAYYGIKQDLKAAVAQYEEAAYRLLVYGSEDEKFLSYVKDETNRKTTAIHFEGLFPYLWRKLKEHEGVPTSHEACYKRAVCPSCQGERLKEASRAITVLDKRLPEIVNLTLEEIACWLQAVRASLTQNEHALCDVYLLDMGTKLRRIQKLGLSYLTLNRSMISLSNGEAQRLHLASLLDATMSGLLYILDEPTIGLHPKDTDGIVEILKDMRNLGNTVLVIEHDAGVLQQVDYLVDIGPKAGIHGGQIVAQGSFAEVLKCKNSAIAYAMQHLTGKVYTYRKPSSYIQITNACQHNLQHVDVQLPIHLLCGICGVSGSGKSTLVFDVLAKGNKQTEVNRVEGLAQFDQMICIDQQPPIRMKRSNIATFTNLATPLRKVYAKTKQAKAWGFTDAYFSFNSKKGRCEHCEGMGTIKSHMLFFQDQEVICPQCHGKQFQEQVLRVTYQGYSIHEVLQLSVEEAITVFKEEKEIQKILRLLEHIGLGYVKLNQSLTTLSQGEAQRLKLARELLQTKGKQNLYLLDEPTVGLHMQDVENFIKLLQELVEEGHSILVIEHNEQLLAACDYLIELGPQGGVHGGQLIAQGSPLALLHQNESVIAPYLKKFIKD